LKKILVVDYDQSTYRLLSRLDRLNFVVDSVSNGQHAIRTMKKIAYDGVLVSLSLPDTDANDLLIFINKLLPSAAKVIITGFPSLKNAVKALENGADAIFAKPVNPEEIAMVVNEKIQVNQKKQAKAEVFANKKWTAIFR
jgi:DNA-binding NtrC family response regulator